MSLTQPFNIPVIKLPKVRSYKIPIPGVPKYCPICGRSKCSHNDPRRGRRSR